MTAVPPEVASGVAAHLAAMEHQYGIRVLFACESGSRAWGFASADSDYDVRFIYVRPLDWYLTIEAGRDVIEEPITGDMDVAGWDLRKALGLLRGGNATLVEWFDSPVVYAEASGFRDAFARLAAEVYRPERSFHHYHSLSEKYLTVFRAKSEVTLKKLLYSTRTALAAEWALTRDGLPPMRLADLADAVVEDAAVRSAIESVVEAKRAGAEGTASAIPEVLLDYLAGLIARHEQARPEPLPPAPSAPFDAFFRTWIGEG